MRVTQELLYDSETTLRLVDRVLEDLDMSDPLRPDAGTAGYGAQQLRGGEDADNPSMRYLRAYWEVHAALEILRDGHAALQPSAGAERRQADEQDRLSRALSAADQLRSEDEDPEREPAHEALRRELLALAEHLRSRDDVAVRLHLTADLLRDLEARLGELARIFDSGQGGSVM